MDIAELFEGDEADVEKVGYVCLYIFTIRDINCLENSFSKVFQQIKK